MEWTPPAVRHHGANGETALGRARQGGVPMEQTPIAVDLAKSVFQVAVSHGAAASMKNGGAPSNGDPANTRKSTSGCKVPNCASTWALEARLASPSAQWPSE